jgi:hypothetical protein
MSRAGLGAAAVVLLATAGACSGGGGGRDAVGTTTTTTTSSTSTTTTTLSQEDQVKQAYLAYWQMVDRLIAVPNPRDSELPERATDPLLASLRDDLTTRAAEERSTRAPVNSKYQHKIRSASLDGDTATVSDCYVDDRVQYNGEGVVLNDRVSTVHATATLTRSNVWRVSDVQTERVGDASVGCG